MSRERNPEIRPNPELPLFEQAISGARGLAAPAENRVPRESKLESRVANSLSPNVAIPLCECGCGQAAIGYRGVMLRFVHGHNKRKPYDRPCAKCGTIISGRYCRECKRTRHAHQENTGQMLESDDAAIVNEIEARYRTGSSAAIQKAEEAQ